MTGATAERRFVNLVDAYDPRLRLRLKKAAAGAGVNLQESIFMWLPGPSFETPAEVKVARQLGADVIGMSIVPKAIIARSLGLRVAAQQSRPILPRASRAATRPAKKPSAPPFPAPSA
ncbi:MAG TPA: hypothetical protein VKE72_02755 [Methylocella sp.]|nr:hypothetical protein [Methylocella sp.]